ncbi:MAG: hypothetical protein V4466_11245 [Pseudomonadota bacterium]
MKASTIVLVAALSLAGAPARAAELPLTTQLQALCLPFVEGRRPLEDVIALAQRTGYPNRETSGVFHELSGPAGRLGYAAMADGRRSCDFERPQGAYRQVLADLKVWISRVPGGPWTATTPEGPDVAGKRVAGWTGAAAVVGVTEDFNADGDLVLMVEARSKAKP